MTMRYERWKRSRSPAAKSFTPFIGVCIARLLINRGPYRWGHCRSTRLLMSGFKMFHAWYKMGSFTKFCINQPRPTFFSCLISEPRQNHSLHATQVKTVSFNSCKLQMSGYRTIARFINKPFVSCYINSQYGTIHIIVYINEPQ